VGSNASVAVAHYTESPRRLRITLPTARSCNTGPNRAFRDYLEKPTGFYLVRETNSLGGELRQRNQQPQRRASLEKPTASAESFVRKTNKTRLENPTSCSRTARQESSRSDTSTADVFRPQNPTGLRFLSTQSPRLRSARMVDGGIDRIFPGCKMRPIAHTTSGKAPSHAPAPTGIKLASLAMSSRLEFGNPNI